MWDNILGYRTRTGNCIMYEAFEKEKVILTLYKSGFCKEFYS
tara:strand:+ start:154 stop:279 length:126 start_codon:yes stop_codon:yes gene_type:complete